MDAAARTNNPELASIKLQSAQMAMAEYKEMITKYGARRRDKTGEHVVLLLQTLDRGKNGYTNRKNIRFL